MVKNKLSAAPHTGNAPAHGTLMVKNHEWAVYLLTRQPPYVNFKLVALVPMRKANLWLTWNVEAAALVPSNDTRYLQAQLPVTAAWLVRCMQGL